MKYKRAANIMGRGRPTKYKEDTPEKAMKYLENYQSLGEAIPSVAGLALYLEVNKDTVYEWSKDPKKHDFSVVTKRIAQSQEIALINGGLLSTFNPTMAKLVLATHHGYSDKQEVKQDTNHSGSVDGKFTVEFISED